MFTKYYFHWISLAFAEHLKRTVSIDVLKSFTQFRSIHLRCSEPQNIKRQRKIKFILYFQFGSVPLAGGTVCAYRGTWCAKLADKNFFLIAWDYGISLYDCKENCHPRCDAMTYIIQYAGCFKKSFTILRVNINLFREYVQYFLTVIM
jgi:hypothetical protein